MARAARSWWGGGRADSPRRRRLRSALSTACSSLCCACPPVVVTLSMYFILIGVNLEIAPSPQYRVSTLAAPLCRVDRRHFPARCFTDRFSGADLVPARPDAVPADALRRRLQRCDGLLVRGQRRARPGRSPIRSAGSSPRSAESRSFRSSSSERQPLDDLRVAGDCRSGARRHVAVGRARRSLRSLLGAASIYLLGTLLITLQVDPSWLQVMYGGMLVVRRGPCSASPTARRRPA